MIIREVVKVDGKGRITIPSAIRVALGISEGSKLMLVADTSTRSIVIKPFSEESYVVSCSLSTDLGLEVVVETLAKMVRSSVRIDEVSCYKLANTTKCRLILSIAEPKLIDRVLDTLTNVFSDIRCEELENPLAKLSSDARSDSSSDLHGWRL